MRYCMNCGSMNDTDAKFCSGCGKKFETVTDVEATPVAEPVVEHEAAAVTEPVVEPAIAPAAEPVVEHEAAAVAESVIEPETTPVAEHVVEPAAAPVITPVVVAETVNDQHGQENVNNVQSPQSYRQYDNRQIFERQDDMSSSKNNGYSIASLVLGICSIVFSWIIPVLPLAAGIIGLVLGHKAKKSGDNGKAKAGRITSIIGIVLIAVQLLLIIIAVAMIGNAIASNPGIFEDMFENIYDLYYLR